MATLGGVTINITKDRPVTDAKIARNQLAATARTSNHNLGAANIKWDVDAFVKTEADYKTLKALVGQEEIIFVDKFGDSFTVDIISLVADRRPHDFMNLKLKMEESS